MQIGIDSRKFIFKRKAHKTLSSKMINFIWLYYVRFHEGLDNFKRSSMKLPHRVYRANEVAYVVGLLWIHALRYHDLIAF